MMKTEINWTDSHGYIELAIHTEDAAKGSHAGRCDEDIAALRAVPYIAEQLAALSPDVVKTSLREWGAWNDDDMADHDANLSRLLWLACADIVEEG